MSRCQGGISDLGLVGGHLVCLIGSTLRLELCADDLDELSSWCGANPQSDTQSVSGYWLLVSRAMSRVFLSRLLQEHLQWTAARHPPTELR